MTSNPQKRGKQQYVLLPTAGFRADRSPQRAASDLLATVASIPFMKTFSLPMPEANPVKLKVVDSIHEDGPKLVEMTEDDMHIARLYQPHIRLLPLVYYYPARVMRKVEVQVSALTAKKATVAGSSLQFVEKGTGKPVPGAQVFAFTDFISKVGTKGVTDSHGRVTLKLGSKSVIERLYVYPSLGCWSRLLTDVKLATVQKIELEPLDLRFTAFPDSLRFFYGNGQSTGAGVRVGVIDTGVDLNHKDLSVKGGRNTVVGENPGDFGDNAQGGHGSHVAGIIGARGTPPTGLAGLAPQAEIFSYRVFGQDEEGASNYSIAKALDWAANTDGCHLINMSLGGGPPDDVIKEAIDEARTAGAVVIVAAGNDDRSPVSFPASYISSIAVSALGRRGTFPAGSTEERDIQEPFGTDPMDFMASFSNVGPEIDLAGPGVGVVSTVPGGYCAMSGTSMACPAVTGVAARLLSGHPEVLSLSGLQRVEGIKSLLLGSAGPRGFGLNYEGMGMPA